MVWPSPGEAENRRKATIFILHTWKGRGTILQGGLALLSRFEPSHFEQFAIFVLVI